MKATISIQRYNPETDSEPRWVEYHVPMQSGSTVMECLNYIYENEDSTLAFQQGCRFNSCGLCALMVNNKPQMACVAKLRDQIKIAPLKGMSVIRDLVVDRTAYFNMLRELQLYIPEQEKTSIPAKIIEPQNRVELLQCVECLACNSTCEQFVSDGEMFAGPYVFVKLAQLHLDPRNDIDRKSQAVKLGLDKCVDCGECRCINGINIQKLAIELLRIN